MAFSTWNERNERPLLDMPPLPTFGDVQENERLADEFKNLEASLESSNESSYGAGGYCAGYSAESLLVRGQTSLSQPLFLPTHTRHYRTTKRIFDLVISFLLLPLLGVLLIVIGLAVAFTSGFPVFYRQHRLGHNGKTFRIFKFRTMPNNADQALAEWLLHHPELRQEWQRTHKLKQDPRITRLGRFLRDTSLDEIPQIINVLRGEMSLVGPRPIVQAERVKYAERFAYYTAAVPGITGLWQVSGRCNVTYEERVRMDEEYVRTWSLLRDVMILLRTPRSVLRRDGAC